MTIVKDYFWYFFKRPIRGQMGHVVQIIVCRLRDFENNTFGIFLKGLLEGKWITWYKLSFAVYVILKFLSCIVLLT